MGKKIAVIGAGASGLTAIKSCIEEGLEPVCFERTKDIGGLWRYTESVEEKKACVYRSTVINTSKEMMCYSDYPIPKEYPNFMHNTYVQKYFNLYSDHFNLREYIKFEHEILHASKSADFDQTGQWTLEVKNLVSGQVTTQVFDGMLVCTGHHADKYTPSFPDVEKFQGQTVHSHDYRHAGGLDGKRVVIIGIGNSGGDIAVELARVASQVYLSTRRGSWVLNRVGPSGLPIDIAFTKRSATFVSELMPWLRDAIVTHMLNSRFNHENYGLKPKHSPFQQHPMVNDDLPNRILCGSVIIKPDIKRFTAHGIEFDDGTTVDDIDLVVFATGYTFGFPFVDKEVLNVERNQVDLYKYVFPPRLEKPTLAVIGYIQPLGAINPLSELQCRWAARVFAGETQLPSQDEMLQDIQLKRDVMAKRYVKSQRHTIQVDWIPYMDELAEKAGCKPRIGKLVLQDPALAFQVVFGPCTPYQYRLDGPHKWPGARNAIMTTMERVLYPTKTRPVTPSNRSGGFLKILILLAILVAILIKFFL